MYRINPAFHRHPDEAAIIGRLVVAFGELEYITVTIAGRAMSHREAVYRALYRLRATSSRIDAADALMRPTFIANDLDNEYGHMIGAVRYCLRIRNQYSHCNWADNGGLFFTNLETRRLPRQALNIAGTTWTCQSWKRKRPISFTHKVGCITWSTKLQLLPEGQYTQPLQRPQHRTDRLCIILLSNISLRG